MVASNLHYFVVDEQVRPFVRDERHDLVAPNTPRRSADEFIIFQVTPPKNQVIVIKSISPSVWRRTDTGSATLASAQMIPAIEANGFFSFEPLVNNQSPFIIETDVNAMRAIAPGPLDDLDRVRAPGFTSVSDNPVIDIFRYKDNPFSIIVRGEKTFQLVMKILRVGTVSPLPNPFRVGNPPAAGQKRVDFAGALVCGVTMPDQLYNDIAKKWSLTGGSDK